MHATEIIVVANNSNGAIISNNQLIHSISNHSIFASDSSASLERSFPPQKSSARKCILLHWTYKQETAQSSVGPSPCRRSRKGRGKVSTDLGGGLLFAVAYYTYEPPVSIIRAVEIVVPTAGVEEDSGTRILNLRMPYRFRQHVAGDAFSSK